MTINEPKNNYKIPLDFSSFFDERKGGLGKCTEVESIDAHIELLITTYQGECSFDKQYGTSIGELDFEQVKTVEGWKEEVSESLKKSISLYEPRITILDFQMNIDELLEEDSLYGNVNIRKRVNILIKTKLKSNGNYCTFQYQLYLSTLAKN